MLRLKTFGGLGIQREDTPPGPGATQRRRLGLLALLARAGDRGISRDKLLGLLWPESEPPFLDGIYITDAAEFERWVEGERTDLARRYADALDRLAAQATARGDHRAAVGWWRKLGAADPLSARVATGLMRALAAAGDRGGAIQHARVHAALLREELDAEPDPGVIALAEQLKAAGGSPPPSPPAPVPVSPAPVPVPTTALVASSSAPPAPPFPARRGRLPAWVGPALLAALLVAAGVLAGRRLLSRPEPGGRKMLAVLPFQNLGRPDDEYFADGLTEEVTSRLASIGGIGVISRTSSMQYKQTGKSLRQIAQELGVDYVLEGSVRWEHLPDGTSRVRVTPQLIQVSDDSHLWADRYDADLADVFRVQGDIAEEVASALDVTLSRQTQQSLGARLTDSLRAYDQYLRASTYFDRAWGDDSSLAAAVRILEETTRLDPTFAVAHAKLSIAYAMTYRLVENSDSILGRAKAEADTALRLGGDLAEGHTALGYWHYWGRRDYARAREEFQRALALRPNDADVLAGLGSVERREGRWADAVSHLRKAADLDPRSSDKTWNIGLALLFYRDFAASERYLDRAIALAPNWAFPYGTKAALYLNWTGDRQRAAEVIRGYPVDDLRQLAQALGLDRFLVMGDSGQFRSLARLTVKEFEDTLNYYNLKAEWEEARDRPAPARAYWDSMATAYARRERLEPENAPTPCTPACARPSPSPTPIAPRDASRPAASGWSGW